MIKQTLQGVALLAATAGLMLAQNTLPSAAGQPAAQPGAEAPPQPTQEEVKEFQKVNSTKDADSRIKAADEFFAKFPNGPLTSYVMEMAGEANQIKGDSARAVFYYQKSLDLNPNNYNAMLMIAAETAQGTREFDLDKDQKLAKATKLVNDAMALIPTAVKPNNGVSDAQWEEIKKDDMARGHMALGLVAMADQKFPDAVKEFQAALDVAAHPDPVTQIRLGNAMNENKQYDEAISMLDKVIANPQLPQNLKDFAQNEKKRSQQLKAANK